MRFYHSANLGDNKFWVNAYFDTPNGKFSCNTPIGNCDNKVKWYDGSLWEMISTMTIEFNGNAKCITYEQNHNKFKEKGCTDNKYMVCRLTCCK